MPQHIITEIEMHVQRTMQTHRDFVWLSETIQNRMGEYISATTLSNS